MPRRSLSFVALLTLAAACSSVATPAAVTVNGAEISDDTVRTELDAVRGNETYRSGLEQNLGPAAGESDETTSTAFVAQLLSLRVYYQLFDQELADKDVTVTREQLDAAREALLQQVPREDFDELPSSVRTEVVRRQAVVEALRGSLQDEGSDPEEAEQFYRANQALFTETCLSHILIGNEQRTQEEAVALATDLAAQLAAGADFAQLANENSEDPGNQGQNGGDLGCGAPIGYVPEFADAASTLGEGEVSSPVATQFGAHVILLQERRAVLPLEEVRPQIEARLGGAEAEQQDPIGAFVQTASCDAEVNVNPRYGRWNTDDCEGGGLGRVDPPEGPTTTAGEVPPGDPGLLPQP